MSVYVYIPPVNPIRFVEKNQSFTDDYGFKPYGDASHLDKRQAGEVIEPYYQPFKKSGILSLQIQRALDTATKVKFYSADTGNLLHTVTVSNPPLTLTTNIIPNTDNEQMYVQLIVLQPSTYSQLNNHDLVWIEIEIEFSGTFKYLLSTFPVYLFTENDGFSEIKYTCNTNKFDVFWANKNPLYYPSFTFYIESQRIDRGSSFEHTTYDEMNGTTEELYSNVRDMYTFIGGGKDGVPAEMIDILDRALACDNKTIDGRKYRLKEVGEPSGKEYRQTKEYVLSEEDDTLKHTYRDSTLTLWEEPATSYPYAVGNMVLQDASGRTIQLEARILDSISTKTALLSTLNARALAAGSSGTFSEAGGVFSFENGTNETFAIASDIQVLPYELTIDIDALFNGDVYSHISAFADTFDHYHIINWGLGSAITDDELWTNSGASSIVATKTYATATTATIRLFHKNEDTSFQNLRNTIGGVYITDMAGEISSALTSFRIERHDFGALTSLNLSFLAPAKDTLQSIVIRSSLLDGITATWASALVSGSYKPYTALRYVDFSGNTFNATFVDAFLNEFDTSTNYQPGFYTLNVKFMSPAAPPTGASSTARANIIAKFWQLFTD